MIYVQDVVWDCTTCMQKQLLSSPSRKRTSRKLANTLAIAGLVGNASEGLILDFNGSYSKAAARAL